VPSICVALGVPLVLATDASHHRAARVVPAPVIAVKPARRTLQRAARFTFTDKQHHVTFQCSLDGSAYVACVREQRYGAVAIVTPCPRRRKPGRTRGRCVASRRRGAALSVGRHVFRVRARGRTGALSRPASYVWVIEGPAPAPAPTNPPAAGETPESLSISGSPSGVMYPGGPPVIIPLTLSNPNQVPVYVTGVTVTLEGSPTGCDGGENLALTQSNASPTTPLLLAAGGSVTLPSGSVSAPAARLLELATVNQDACEGASFALHYTATAHS
jgi:hypothetical protein